jgi:hypothetical protein
VFPQKPAQYIGVHALLLNWLEDDLGTHDELIDLQDVFQDQFNFTAEIWRIPSSQSEDKLEQKISQVKAEFGGENRLLIVYYGGHGKFDVNGRSIWHAWSKRKGKPKTPVLNWYSLQPMLKRAACDVLITLDCCFAASAARGDVNGINELLAACGREVEAVGVSDRSFTRNLIRKLRSFGTQPFTVSQLYERLLKDRKRLMNTPGYFPLSGPNMPSICLAPLPAPGQQGMDALSTTTSAPDRSSVGSSSTTSSTADVSLQTSNTTPMSTPPSSSPEPDCPRVLLAVSLKDDTTVPDISQWIQWLTTEAPFDIRNVDIKIESAYHSHSTLMLVNVPATVWSHLPNNSSYRFVGFVTSPSLVASSPASSAPQVANIPNQKYLGEQKTEKLVTPLTTSPRVDLPGPILSKESIILSRLHHQGLSRRKTLPSQDLEQMKREMEAENYQNATAAGETIPLTADTLRYIRRSQRTGNKKKDQSTASSTPANSVLKINDETASSNLTIDIGPSADSDKPITTLPLPPFTSNLAMPPPPSRPSHAPSHRLRKVASSEALKATKDTATGAKPLKTKPGSQDPKAAKHPESSSDSDSAGESDDEFYDSDTNPTSYSSRAPSIFSAKSYNMHSRPSSIYESDRHSRHSSDSRGRPKVEPIERPRRRPAYSDFDYAPSLARRPRSSVYQGTGVRKRTAYPGIGDRRPLRTGNYQGTGARRPTSYYEGADVRRPASYSYSEDPMPRRNPPSIPYPPTYAQPLPFSPISYPPVPYATPYSPREDPYSPRYSPRYPPVPSDYPIGSSLRQSSQQSIIDALQLRLKRAEELSEKRAAQLEKLQLEKRQADHQATVEDVTED